MTKQDLLRKYKRIKNMKLVAAILIDLVGVSSFFLPIVWESSDLVWAPISGLLIFLLFPNRKKNAIAGVIEEILPFTDVIPTACLAWRLEYVKHQEETLARFIKHELTEDLMIGKMVEKLDPQVKDVEYEPVIDG